MGTKRVAIAACAAAVMAAAVGFSSREELRSELRPELGESLAVCLEISGVTKANTRGDLWFASYLSKRGLTSEYRPVASGPGVHVIRPRKSPPDFIVFAVGDPGEAHRYVIDPSRALWVGYLWAPVNPGRFENADRACF